MPIIERTNSFPRERPIDCRDWLEFTIVEATYRAYRIRFTKVDADGGDSLELPASDKDSETT